MKNYDVVVIGGGPAGIAAALAAGRSGVRTLLIEKNSILGGQMTSGLVTGFHGLRVHHGFTKKGSVGSVLMTDKHTPLVVKGLSLELMNRLSELGAAFSQVDDPPMRVEYDPEVMIPLLFKMCAESNVELLLNSHVFGVIMEGNRITHVRVANKSGETQIASKMFVDASADGDILAWAGCEYTMGDSNGRCMPLSVYQVLGNVDLQKTLDYMRAHPEDLHISTVDRWQELYDRGEPVSIIGLRSLVKKAAEAGEYPRALNLVADIPYPIFDIQGSFLPRGTVKLLVDMAYGIDSTNATELTKAEIDMRMNQVPGIYRFMKKYVPGFEDCYIIGTSPLIGTRESRRLCGQYQITKDDVMANRRFSDKIGCCGRAMNVHSSGGGDQSQDRGGQQWIEAEDPIGFDIPYRAITPKTVSNLLVSGRCISVDRDALGSVRGEPICIVTGEAAGAATAMAAQSDTSVQDLNIQMLQSELRNRNVMLD